MLAALWFFEQNANTSMLTCYANMMYSRYRIEVLEMCQSDTDTSIVLQRAMLLVWLKKQNLSFKDN